MLSQSYNRQFEAKRREGYQSALSEFNVAIGSGYGQALAATNITDKVTFYRDAHNEECRVIYIQEGYEKGYGDGISDQDFLYDATNGIFQGLVSFYNTLADGISIFGISLGSIVATVGVIIVMLFVLKILRG